MSDDLDWLAVDADTAAKRLLGATLIREINGQQMSGKIVEVEAYSQDDPASHTYRGKTMRNASMFGSAGHSYVYFTYGMHHCVNIVSDREGFGSGVLIRALEPLEGLELMAANRGKQTFSFTEAQIKNLCSGPGKVCQALKIDRALDGHDLTRPPLRLKRDEALAADQIVQTTRIGISRAIDHPRRYYIKNNPYISKK